MALARGKSEQSLYSQSWYRVAGLKPRLRSHIRIHRQSFRNREWYLLQDHATGRFHRISPEAYFIIGLMDGRRTMADIWDAAMVQLGDNLPTQEEVISLLSQIHRFDGLQADLPPDMTELGERSRREKRSKVLGYLASPTSLKIHLLDPDRFLDAVRPLVAPLFGWLGGLIWFSVVLYGLMLAGMHWGELTANITDRVLSLENMVILSLVYPAAKALHELGHACAVKRWGGEVHDMGIMLLVFIPVPYLDATASYSFRDRKKRMLVSAAGILVELFVAALAMAVWVNAGPGAVRTVAYNMMLICGVSTLLMNGNPLIRYDAYYILSDFLEIPNLATRSSEYLGYFSKRYLLGIREAETTAQTATEAWWLALYGITSFAYRTVLMVAIVLFVAGKFFVIGVIVALWTLFCFIAMPLQRLVRHMAVDPLLQRYRVRALLGGGVAVTLLAAAVAGMEIPSFTVVEGVVWVPSESQVTAGADGFVSEVLVPPNSVVRRGEPLIRCESQKLDKEVEVLKGNLGEVEARYQLSRVTDLAAAQVMKEEMAKSRSELNRARERAGDQIVRSPADGVFLLPQPEDLPGRFVKKGAALGYVVDFSHSVIRIVAGQDDVEMIRGRARKVEARLASNLAVTLPASVVREVPAASSELPSMALSTSGGGTIALDPNGNSAPKSFRKNFLFDLELSGTTLSRVGERAFVRFDHLPETLAVKWYRNIRRVLVRMFDH